MRKYYLFSLISFLVIANSLGKSQKLSNFRIDGTINADSGKVTLVFFSAYLPDKTEQLVAQVKNKKFSFSGYIPESQGVFIAFDGGYTSNFIIDKGEQTVSINIDSSRTMPKIRNKTMLEEYPKWIGFTNKITAKYESLLQQYDSLQKNYNRILPKDVSLAYNKEMEALYKENDSTLLRYAEKNPNSKIAFWKLINLMDWGYEPIFDPVYNAFSNTLRGGYAGKILDEKLKIGKLLSVGQQFPDINCLNAKGEEFSPGIFLKNKLTLVDFWYSNCGPCRRQFPNMRDLYKQYGDKGFEIVGISVDKTEYRKEWEDLIIKEKLVWMQYWDKDGKEANRLSIKAYPMNFLIDSAGKIIYKSISMEALEELLNKELK